MPMKGAFTLNNSRIRILPLTCDTAAIPFHVSLRLRRSHTSSRVGCQIFTHADGWGTNTNRRKGSKRSVLPG